MKKVLKIVFIILGLLLSLGVGIFIGSKYAEKPKDIEVENIDKEKDDPKNNEAKDETLNMNLNQLTTTLNTNFSDALCYVDARFGENILSNVDNRMLVINYILIDVAKRSSEIDPTVQDHPYIEYTVYKDKYESIYGRNYNFISDLNNCSAPIANNNDELVGDKYISFNDTRSPIFKKMQLEANNITKEANNYMVSGSYVALTLEGKSKTGSFEISFVKEGNQFAYSSIVLN